MSEAEQRILCVLTPRLVMIRSSLVPKIWDEYGTALSVLSPKGRAIYLASQDALYLIGGEELSGLTGLRRYSFEQGYTKSIDTSVTEGEVAAFAVDPFRHRAYALFIDRGETAASARLAAIDLNTGDSRLLLRVPYDGAANHRVGLSVGLKGEVIILANRAGGSVAGWLYEESNATFAFIGGWSADGTMIDAPHPSHPALLLDVGGALSHRILDRADFTLGDELAAL